ncbi:MAG: type II toxin-antitoxin system VapC family toxin [Proteobacteria bacterium]|nr:type II toxin-antitoxin system VapC family toxin [Burkholderiales bacterium]MCA0309977.1 type II toxin-antitoxin system VapC family toxin [Pseudomonadota bacterium]
MSAAGPTLYVAEPPATYLHRPALVVDCSVLAGVLFQEPWQDEARSRIAERRLFAPYLLAHELCSVALKKARQGAIVAAQEGLARWQELSVELCGIDVEQTFSLAQRYRLSAYDASYLCLAAELKCPLATFDQTLAQAAQRHRGSLG